MDTYYRHFKVHPIHPFPARMAPSIALNSLRSQRSKQLIVLDPMAGSGTTVMAARKCGHVAIGFDTDPLAALLTRVCTSDLNAAALGAEARTVETKARRIYLSLKLSEAYPHVADEETRAFLRFWFDPVSRRQLTCLSFAIEEARPFLRAALWCAFSRLIIAKENGASLARDLSHSRPHKSPSMEPLRPFDHFEQAVDFVARNAPFAGRRTEVPRSTVKIADARRMPLPSGSVDRIITSPPYLNAIDYVRCSKFSLVWMGHTIGELRSLRATNIGSEVSLDERNRTNALVSIIDEVDAEGALAPRDRAIVARYVQDMDRVIAEMHRVLRQDGKVTAVIGNSNVRGFFVENSLTLTRLFSRHGFVQRRRIVRELPPNRRYLPPPTRKAGQTGMHSRMRQEVVLTFSRSR